MQPSTGWGAAGTNSAGFNLYLVSNAEHCVAFTSQPDTASGIVVATVDPD